MPSRAMIIAGAFGLLCAIAAPPATAQTDDELIELYTNEVQPLLDENCYECHGGRRRVRGAFDLTTREGLFSGGFLGPAVDLEDPDQSLILAMISYRDEDHQMPPTGKLADDQIALITHWIRAGAPFNETAASKPQPEPEIDLEEFSTIDPMKGWSYEPLERPSVPEVSDPEWAENPIDAFIYSRLEKKGLEPVGPAAPLAWLRRATYDLTGLPPTPREIDDFLADTAPGAKRRVIDRLLDSPQYGERWGRHWLDVVRYAETNGYERDNDKPFIWRYRDYVVNAFNEDKPYDELVREQIAGDELESVTAESIIASGYNRLMLWDDEPGEGALQGRYDVLADIVQTTGEAFLGMTLGCARCHDHKADPITQRDFYRFMGFFHGLSDMRTAGTLVPIPTPEEQREHDRAVAEKEARIRSLVAEVRELETDFLARLARSDQIETLHSDLVDLRYRFYRDTWEKLPDFDRLRFEDEGELPGGFIDLSVATRHDAMGLVFEGQLVVPETGAYRFTARAADGLRLIIGDEIVLERDGIRNRPRRASATVSLEKGLQPLRLEYFNRRGRPVLELDWQPAEPLEWRYRFDEPEPGWAERDFDDSSWASGAGGFGAPDTPETEIATEWTTEAIWLRTQFEWHPGEELSWVLHHDEDLEVSINGRPVLSLGGYRVDYGQVPFSDEARAALSPGSNVLAVHCRNASGAQYVHVVPVPTAQLTRSTLRDAAFDRRSLTTPDSRSAVGLAELIERRGNEVLTESELERYRGSTRALEHEREREIPIRRAFAATEREEIPDLHVHIRGSANSPGEKVEPGFPSVLGDPDPDLSERERGDRSSGRRRVLAEWLTRDDHPLTSRVMANRIWQYHFGRGIVPTPNDFGELGERPTHPDLLDWLATELVAQGWSIKALHRLIMTSRTYGLSSDFDESAFAKDSRNDDFWRFDLRRLGAEELRDTILSLTGELNLKVGGPSFYEPLPPEVLATSSRPDAAWGRSPERETQRRSLYIKVKRSLKVPLLQNFDLADTDSSCPVRFETTQPTQALNLLNGSFIHGHAEAFADRLIREVGHDDAAQVRQAWRLATGRSPSDAEVREGLAFRDELREELDLSDRRVAEMFCLLILNLNELVFLD